MVVTTIPRERWRRLQDVLAATTLCALDLLVSWVPGTSASRPAWWVPAYAAAGYTALVLRRDRPRTVLAVMVVHSVLGVLVLPGYVATLGVWLALYTVASRCVLRDAIVALLASLLPAGEQVRDALHGQTADDRLRVLVGVTTGLLVVHLAIFGVGRWARWSVAQRRIIAVRSAAEAVARERTTIAHDLHDVVAHSITLMLLQAGGAAALLRTDPDRARTALQHVDSLGQQAIVELRRLVALIRPDQGGPGPGPASPAGMENLTDLLDRTRAAGREVRFDVRGEPRPLEPGVDMTAYRIVQEAVTNAARYAVPETPMLVDVRWSATSLELSVVNERDGRGSAVGGAGSGHGLVGMRERVRSVDGDLTVGPTPDGRFRVTARLPVVTLDHWSTAGQQR